jgi:hypothetical protein
MKISTRVVPVAAMFISICTYVACGDDDTAATPVPSDGGTDATTEGGGTDSGGGDSGGTDSGGTDSGETDATVTDGGTDAQLVEDGGIVTDAGPGGDAAVLNCGSASCDLPTQSCCFYPNDAGSFYAACSNGQVCPAVDGGGTPTALACTSQANCGAGSMCCLTSPASGTNASHCVAPAACASTVGIKSAFLCDPAASDAGCGDAGACGSSNIGSWNLPSGFGTCGDVAR